MNKKQIFCISFGVLCLVASLVATILCFVSYDQLGKTASIISGLGGILGAIVSLLSFIPIKSIKKDEDKKKKFGFIDIYSYTYLIMFFYVLSLISSLFDEIVGVAVTFLLLIVSTLFYVQLKRNNDDGYITPFTYFLIALILGANYAIYFANIIISDNSVFISSGIGHLVIFLIMIVLPVLYSIYPLIKFESSHFFSHYLLIALFVTKCLSMAYRMLSGNVLGLTNISFPINEYLRDPVLLGLIFVFGSAAIYGLACAFSYYPYVNDMD